MIRQIGEPFDSATLADVVGDWIERLENGGELRSIELGVPISKVQDWTPELNDLDERRGTQHWKGSDTLVFSDIDIE